MNQREILVTAALPYANGEIHVGHLVEYIQADIWSRFQKMRGHNCLYFCADDTHGTPIMIRARQEGISPEELIRRCHIEHEKDFMDFDIEFDEYHTTNSDENRETVEFIFRELESKGLVTTKLVKQPYCEQDEMFLPDRFVQGNCPKCGSSEEYGDSCDSCGSTYSPSELKNAHCSVCGNPPTERESEHVFYKLSEGREFLTKWVKSHTSEAISKKLMEWLEGDLRDWDISRDAPYFGFEIPGHPKKYFYVWADAPVGYIGTTKKWCRENGRNYEDFWRSDKSEIYHFIGKDIAYHHTLFWPFMLHNAGLSTPTQVFVHGMLTVNGDKMSKSKGTFINARTYLKYADPMYLRYYYATKLTDSIDDFDLNFEDFVSRVNSELVGKITNLASRGAQMLGKKIDGTMGSLSGEALALVQKCQGRSETIAQLYESREFSKAIIEVRQLADAANRYFDEKEPWKLIKEDLEATREVLTATLNVFRTLAIYLKPVIPSYAKDVETLFNEAPYLWSDSQTILENHSIGVFSHLAQRLEIKQLEKIIEEEKQQQPLIPKK
ncbi:methionine--tRNA ligase [Bdellovibrionales bacterium]|nr:methionine--tRNA ligase [Bdellovibrionales bacterium]